MYMHAHIYIHYIISTFTYPIYIHTHMFSMHLTPSLSSRGGSVLILYNKSSSEPTEYLSHTSTPCDLCTMDH